MKPEIVIRPETSADIEAIAELTRAAFETLEISNQTESFIIEALRAAKALTLSLVAELDGRVNLWGQTRLIGLISCLIPRSSGTLDNTW